MIGVPPFPISIDQLTRTTLCEALDTTIDSFAYDRIGADRGMLGEIFLVRPTYADGCSGPEAVIAKFAALREGALASSRRGGNNERELRCYDELLSTTSVTTPHFYGGWYDPETAHFLLVQEAITADTEVDQVAGIKPALAELVAVEAATLHHERWLDPSLGALGWLPRLDDERRVNNLTTIAANGWEPMCDLLGDELTSSERQLGTEFPTRLNQALTDLAALPSTLIHCDLRADNLLFAADHQSVSLIDWQGAGIGPGSFDIAYLIVHSLTVEDRRMHERLLIESYLDALRNAGTDISHTDFMVGYRLSLHYGLTIACAMPLISDTSQPRVRTLATAMARRSIEALRDHDMLWT